MTETTSPNPIVDWLGGTSTDFDSSWVRWLEGEDRPLTVTQDAPYLWFIESLIAAPDPRRAGGKLASAVRSVLETPLKDLLQYNPQLGRPAKALGNLFQLCAELRERSAFFGPLLSIQEQLERGRRDGEPWVAIWDGTVRGANPLVPLEVSFRRALAFNQNGPELRDRWFDRLRTAMTEPRREFPDVVTAIEAVARMPQSAETAGKPWTDAICEGLALFAQRLEERFPDGEDRNREMTWQINRVKAIFIDWLDADSDLLRAAVHRFEDLWPAWAFRRLRLFAWTDSGDPEMPRKVWVWKYLEKCIPETFEFRRLGVCGPEIIVKLMVSEATFVFLKSVCPLFERTRLENPWPGVGAIMAGVLSVLDRLARIYPELEPQFARVRDRLFEEVCESTKATRPALDEEVSLAERDATEETWAKIRVR